MLENEINVKHIFWFILAFLLVYVIGLNIDVINIDAAQYATISREMYASGNYLQVHCNGNDYLDKPPLLFWLSALSFKVFGVHNWSYKLPSFLFAILGIYSTKKLGELLYDLKTGMIAALLLVSSLGILIMTNDTRTDTLLLGATVFSIWKIYSFLQNKKLLNLILGFIGIGLAMLAKGPLGIMIPILVLSSNFIYKREWKNFFKWEWILGLAIVAVILFPMCYGLYEQFDLHPEKIINGEKNVSGLKFYFWTQSFGRITGSSQWGTKYDNGAGPFFFTHTFLWVFFPWSIFVIGGILKSGIVLVKNKFQKDKLPEVLSVGGFLLTFIALSASRYKLPHYIYVTLPFGAIIAARFITAEILDQFQKKIIISTKIATSFFFAATFIISSTELFVFFPSAPFYIHLFFIVGFILAATFIFKSKSIFQKLFYPLLLGLLTTFFIVDAHFYPNLMEFQSTSVIGKKIASDKISPSKIFYANDITQYALDFYSGYHVPQIGLDSSSIAEQLKLNGELFIYTDEDGCNTIKNVKPFLLTINEYKDIPVQFLSFKFVFPSTRPTSLRKRFFVQVSGGE